MNALEKILNKLVVPQLPHPASVPKELAIRCAERAKKEVTDAITAIKELIPEKDTRVVPTHPLYDLEDDNISGAFNDAITLTHANFDKQVSDKP